MVILFIKHSQLGLRDITSLDGKDLKMTLAKDFTAALPINIHGTVWKINSSTAQQPY